jgi:hypothetical protein
MNPDSPDAAARTTRIAVVHTLREMRPVYPPGSVGWLEEKGLCVECGFARASRLMTDPTCSPPLIYCERCIEEINRCRRDHDESELEETCTNCGGSGQYDDAVQCPTCGGEGVFDG